ncbi:helix-turn-helix domain-containing protein [Streptomyces sp. VNUA24]|uniref:AraC-like ligand-binding domain-containing protein n=1 Tax=Streptomyces sp. VNUA24 TaxID=3031131 RepID=UPI0023B84598|nr:helix-turn-helix domain-containing protein [Streptomyces sp. VNUA24]WEH12836.1 helix-turn-helix domain-containing protein [Streptomyces sp. VNUA24]
MSLALRTADLPQSERFDFWRDIVCDAFVPLRAEPGEGPFRGQLRGLSLGELQVTEIEATAHTVYRTPRTIACSDADYFKLGLQLRGYCLLAQDGREAPLTPGDFAIYDTTRPYTLSFDDSYRQLVLMVPRTVLRVPPDKVSRITAVRVSGRNGIGALVSPLLLRLADHLDEYENVGSLRLADNIVDLLVTLLSERLETEAPSPDSGRRALMMRIASFIERHLGDHDLGPESVAAAHFISTRYLHKLFRDEGTTVSAWIRERRLEHCRRDLRDPLQLSRPVGAIASRWGFADAAHFSRIFRSAYGASPREYRLTSEPAGGLTLSLD